MRRMLAVLLTSASFGCATGQTEVVSSAAADEAVYSSLLAPVFRGTLPDTLLLTDSSAQFRIPREVRSEWRRAFDSIPGDLRTALERLSVLRKPTRNLALPRPVRLVSEREL